VFAVQNSEIGLISQKKLDLSR